MKNYDLCYWNEQENGYWLPSCRRASDTRRLITFAGGKGPVAAGHQSCPNCGRPLFEKEYISNEWREFLDELNTMGV